MHDLLPRLLALLDSEDDGEREAACALLATLAEHHRPSEADRTAALELLRSHLDEPELCGTLAALVLAGGPARRWSELALVVEEGLCGEHADSAAEIVRALLDARVAVPDDLVRRVLEHASEEYAADVLATWLDSHEVAAWVGIRRSRNPSCDEPARGSVPRAGTRCRPEGSEPGHAR